MQVIHTEPPQSTQSRPQDSPFLAVCCLSSSKDSFVSDSVQQARSSTSSPSAVCTAESRTRVGMYSGLHTGSNLFNMLLYLHSKSRILTRSRIYISIITICGIRQITLGHWRRMLPSARLRANDCARTYLYSIPGSSRATYSFCILWMYTNPL